MARMIAKLLALAAFAAVAVSFYLPSGTVRAIAVGVMVVLVGLISFNRKVAVAGDEEMPGLLVCFTPVLLLSPVVLLVLFPAVLSDHQVSHQRFEVTEALVYRHLFAGVLMAVSLWVPFWLYKGVDWCFDQLAKK